MTRGRVASSTSINDTVITPSLPLPPPRLLRCNDCRCRFSVGTIHNTTATTAATITIIIIITHRLPESCKECVELPVNESCFRFAFLSHVRFMLLSAERFHFAFLSFASRS